MDFGPSSTAFAPPRLGLEFVLAPTATATCEPHNHALNYRQESVSVATCGYIGGDADLSVTCRAGLYCATTSTYVGCCESTNCVGIITSCYDFLGNACDVTCQNNPNNLVCPTTLPYCAEYQYEGGSIGYGCARDRGFTTTVLLVPQQNLGSLSTTSSTPTPTPSPTPSPTPEPEPSSSGLSGGAIAGIAIGGVAVLALIIFMIWFMRRRKQKQTKQATETTPYTHVPREDISPVTQTRSTVGSMSFSDSATAYALPSPRTDAWKQSWQSYSEPDATYAASNGYSNPRSPTGVPGAPVEMPGSNLSTYPSELDASKTSNR